MGEYHHLVNIGRHECWTFHMWVDTTRYIREPFNMPLHMCAGKKIGLPQINRQDERTIINMDRNEYRAYWFENFIEVDVLRIQIYERISLESICSPLYLQFVIKLDGNLDSRIRAIIQKNMYGNSSYL